MGLEVFAEGELFREAEFFCYFLDGELRLGQQMFRLADCVGNNPPHRRLPGVLRALRNAGMATAVGCGVIACCRGISGQKRTDKSGFFIILAAL